MSSIPGEIADGLVAVLESAPVQAELTAAITAGEVSIESLGDALISDAKGSGALGLVISATKGTVETQFNAFISGLPPATIAAWLTAKAQAVAKSLGG